ncbi:metacaspase-2-like [Condylostylus longicornis]|uniref:metacaspase-2-like n=1 Tax=Condylostylus longicornis TaxID=2530218 RepID=UPI00244E1F9A|nr:metacaspase-2-like [Condylostylus longicornis]
MATNDANPVVPSTSTVPAFSATSATSATSGTSPFQAAPPTPTLHLEIDPMQYIQNLPEFNGKGNAREVLEINNNIKNWSDMKSVLINNFSDSRTALQIYDELRAVTFDTHSVDLFNKIKKILRQLNNRVKTDPNSVFTVATNIETALNIFKDKLPEPMRSILYCRNPATIEQAMDILHESNYAFYSPFKNKTNFNKPSTQNFYKPTNENYSCRKNHSNYNNSNNTNQTRNYNNIIRNNHSLNNNYTNQNSQNNNFNQSSRTNQISNSSTNNRNNHSFNRTNSNFNSHGTQRIEPMEVDTSTTRRVNNLEVSKSKRNFEIENFSLASLEKTSELPYIKVQSRGRPLIFLIDSGASMSIINTEFLELKFHDKFDGLIGNNILLPFEAEISYKNRILKLNTGNEIPLCFNESEEKDYCVPVPLQNTAIFQNEIFLARNNLTNDIEVDEISSAHATIDTNENVETNSNNSPHENYLDDVEIRSTDATIHSAQEDSTEYIPISELPLNVYKTQIIINIGPHIQTRVKKVYDRTRKIFYHPKPDENFMINILKHHIPPKGIIGIMIDDLPTYNEFRNVYLKHFSKNKSLKLNKCSFLLEDILCRYELQELILDQHQKTNHRAKYERKPLNLPLKITETPHKPLEIIHLDIWFKSKGNAYLTVIDKFSKHAHVIPIKSRNWIDLKNAFMQYISSSGKPKKIITDQEKGFNSLNFKNFLENEGIAVHFTTPNNHSGNADIERFHNTLNEHIRILYAIQKEENLPMDEDPVIKSVKTYNETIHSSTALIFIVIVFCNITLINCSQIEINELQAGNGYILLQDSELRITNIIHLHKKTEIPTNLLHNFEHLKQEFMTLIPYHVNKRGLFNFVGSGLHILAGVMDDDDRIEIEQHFDILKGNNDKITRNLNQQVYINTKLSDQIQNITDHINSVQSKIKESIDELKNDITKIDLKLELLSIKLDLELDTKINKIITCKQSVFEDTEKKIVTKTDLKSFDDSCIANLLNIKKMKCNYLKNLTSDIFPVTDNESYQKEYSAKILPYIERDITIERIKTEFNLEELYLKHINNTEIIEQLEYSHTVKWYTSVGTDCIILNVVFNKIRTESDLKGGGVTSPPCFTLHDTLSKTELPGHSSINSNKDCPLPFQ